MCTAAWMTAKYNAYHYFPNSGVQARVRYFLFVYLDGSLRLCVFGALHLMAGSMITSIASHFVLYVPFFSVTEPSYSSVVSACL